MQRRLPDNCKRHQVASQRGALYTFIHSTYIWRVWEVDVLYILQIGYIFSMFNLKLIIFSLKYTTIVIFSILVYS